MTIRSWVIKSWPEVQWKPPADRSQWPVFQHMGTGMRPSPDESGRKIGDTVWVAHLDEDQLIGAAWEWVELLPGVAAIRDPNGFVSNARLIGDDNDVLDELQCIVGLNRIAYATPWQSLVAQCVLSGEAHVCGPTDIRLLFSGLSAPAGRRVQQLQLPAGGDSGRKTTQFAVLTA
ncbi:MAG: hypothetical protein LH480_08805 [Rubrivivax sp.]|nr:hypothetical protein [Rubrivivax sp.]